MLCKSCGKELKPGAKFCPFCGESQIKDTTANNESIETTEIKLTNHCKSCGKELKPGAKFCPFCGESQIKDSTANNESIETTEIKNTNHCKSCGKELNPGAKFCPFCGESQFNGQNRKEDNKKAIKKNKLKTTNVKQNNRNTVLSNQDKNSGKNHKLCFISIFALFFLILLFFIFSVKKEKETYYSGQYEPTNSQAQYEPTSAKESQERDRISLERNTQSEGIAHYVGYLATVDDLVKLKKFIDSHCGEKINLEFYYPENLSLKFVDLSSEPVEYKNFSLRDNMNTSVSNVFSAWGKNSFIYVASSLLYSERSQYDHKYERYNGHLNFWLHGTNIKPNMFILNIKSNYGQITWETSSDIDDDIREFNFKLCQDDPNFKTIHLKGTFTVESPVNSNDFNKHAGYPTYPEEWQNLDYDYVYFSPDGEPTDMVVYDLIPK